MVLLSEITPSQYNGPWVADSSVKVFEQRLTLLLRWSSNKTLDDSFLGHAQCRPPSAESEDMIRSSIIQPIKKDTTAVKDLQTSVIRQHALALLSTHPTAVISSPDFHQAWFVKSDLIAPSTNSIMTVRPHEIPNRVLTCSIPFWETGRQQMWDE